MTIMMDLLAAIHINTHTLQLQSAEKFEYQLVHAWKHLRCKFWLCVEVRCET